MGPFAPLLLEEEIRDLLEHSKWRGKGPHGRTINAVMKRVAVLRKQALKIGPGRVVFTTRKAS